MDSKTLIELYLLKLPAHFTDFLIACILLECLWKEYNSCHLLLNTTFRTDQSLVTEKGPKTSDRNKGKQFTMHCTDQQTFCSGEMGRHAGVSSTSFSRFSLVYKAHKPCHSANRELMLCVLFHTMAQTRYNPQPFNTALLLSKSTVLPLRWPSAALQKVEQFK